MMNMRIAAGIVLLGTAVPASAGYELVCKGTSAGGGNTPVIVDCADRRQVVQALHDAWLAVKNQRIGSGREEMCSGPYQQARNLPPSVDIRSLAPNYFTECNAATAYLRRGLR